MSLSMDDFLDKHNSLRRLMDFFYYVDYIGKSLPSEVYEKEFQKNRKLQHIILKLAELISRNPQTLFINPHVSHDLLRENFKRLCEYDIRPRRESDIRYVIDCRSGMSENGVFGDVIQRYFQPHFLDVRVHGKSSLRDNMTISSIKKALWYNFRYKDTPYRSEILKAISFTTGGHGLVTRFSAVLTKAILRSLKAPKDVNVLDPCGGFGGRLLGVMAFSDSARYVCCEPQKKTFLGLKNISKFFGFERCYLSNVPAEKGLRSMKSNRFDIVLTCPPYFTQEVYSNESTQSVSRFPTWEEWSKKWLREVIHESLRCLSSGGVSAWAVKDIKVPALQDVLPLKACVKQYHKEKGWSHFKTIVRQGSSRPGSSSRYSQTEVLCFKKNK